MSDLVPVLAIPKGDVGRGSPIPFETVADGPALTRRFADDLMEVYLFDAETERALVAPAAI